MAVCGEGELEALTVPSLTAQGSCCFKSNLQSRFLCQLIRKLSVWLPKTKAMI